MNKHKYKIQLVGVPTSEGTLCKQSALTVSATDGTACIISGCQAGTLKGHARSSVWLEAQKGGSPLDLW